MPRFDIKSLTQWNEMTWTPIIEWNKMISKELSVFVNTNMDAMMSDEPDAHICGRYISIKSKAVLKMSQAGFDDLYYAACAPNYQTKPPN
jgi:hypothetical protein